MKWLISVPVWGERYIKNFLERGLPSLVSAAWNSEIRWLIQTDRPDEFAFITGDIKTIPPPPGANNALKLGNAVRVALAEARPDEAILLFNADMVISRETFLACEAAFASGKLFVTSHSIRTRDLPPPLGADGPTLASWGWLHRHAWVDDCIYRRGHVAGPAVVVFDQPDGVAVHCFSMQCLAVHKIREIEFLGPTADELVDCFAREEVHIVQGSDELALVEGCADDMPYDRGGLLTDKVIVDFAPIYASPMMCWQFAHRYVIRGEPTFWSLTLVDSILARIDRNKSPARLLPYSDQRIAAHVAATARNPSEVVKRLLGQLPGRHLVPKSIRQEVLRWF